MKAFILASLIAVSAVPSVAQTLSITNLGEQPENRLCPDSPPRPDWIADPEPGSQLSQSGVAIDLYEIQGYTNIVDAGECSCELRFPSWDRVLQTIETDYPEMSRATYLEVKPTLRDAIRELRPAAKEICEKVNLW